MSENKNLTIEEAFNLAVKNYLEGRLDIAQELYNQIFIITHNNLSISVFDYYKSQLTTTDPTFVTTLVPFKPSKTTSYVSLLLFLN